MAFWRLSKLNLKSCIRSEISTPKRNTISLTMVGYLYGYNNTNTINQTFSWRIPYSSQHGLAALINVQDKTYISEGKILLSSCSGKMDSLLHKYLFTALSEIVHFVTLLVWWVRIKSGTTFNNSAHINPWKPVSNVLRELADVISRPLSMIFEKPQIKDPQ